MNLGETEKSVDLDKLKSELQTLQSESAASTKQIRTLEWAIFFQYFALAAISLQSNLSEFF